MARIPGHTSRVYLDGYDLSGVSNKVELKLAEQDLQDSSALADPALTSVVGKYKNSATVNAFGDLVTGAWDDVAFQLIAATGDHLLGLVIPAGAAAAAGDLGYELIQKHKAQPRMTSVTEAYMLHLETEGNGRVVRGTVLAPSSVITAAVPVAGSNLNLGTTAAGQTFVAVVRCLAVTGAGSVTVQIQESQNDGGADPYALISGMSVAITAVNQSARLTTTAATETWKRVNISAFSGFTNITLLVVVGREQ